MYSWDLAKKACTTDLVSMESDDEWEYLKNITKTMEGRWYIGLKDSSSKWCWLSNMNDCINQTFSIPRSGKWRWYMHEPNNLRKEHCVEMFRDGSYNNVACNVTYKGRKANGGYICERSVGKAISFLCVNAALHVVLFE